MLFDISYLKKVKLLLHMQKEENEVKIRDAARQCIN